MNNLTKRTLAVIVVVTMLITGCAEKALPSGSSALQSASASDNSSPEPTETGLINSAVSLVPGVEALLESDTGILVLKQYGYLEDDLEETWSHESQKEVSVISNLEWATEDTHQQYQVYFLLVPKYVGSEVLLESVYWDGEKLVADEVLYHCESTPDNYGLMIISREPETIPELQLTVNWNEEQVVQIFGYDGKGDRPLVRILPPDKKQEEGQ